MTQLPENLPPNPLATGRNPALVVVGFVLGLAAATTAWALIGYNIARTLSIGIVLLPIGSGVAGGLAMLLMGKGIGKLAGILAVVETVAGCIIGDFLWIKWFNKKPINELLGAELVPTISAIFNLQKIVLFAVAAYLAYIIAIRSGPQPTNR